MNPIADQAFEAMLQHLTESTIEMFDSYGLAVEVAPPTSEGLSNVDANAVMAVIGYGGERVRGALVLIVPTPAIQSWVTALGEAAQGVDACDVVGEFSNMLLGRLKGRLLPEGIPLFLSTPTTASGSQLRLPPPPHPSSLMHFDGPGWRMAVRIDATFEDGFVLQARDTAASAGDAMFF